MPRNPTARDYSNRTMRPEDFPAVLAIDKRSFGLDCWEDKDWYHFYRQKHAAAYVIELEGANEIAGFFVCLFYAEQIEVIRLAIDPAHRRRGLLRRITGKLRSKIHEPNTQRLIGLNVDEFNAGAHSALRRCGWKAKMIRGRGPDQPDTYRFFLVCNEEIPVS